MGIDEWVNKSNPPTEGTIGHRGGAELYRIAHPNMGEIRFICFKQRPQLIEVAQLKEGRAFLYIIPNGHFSGHHYTAVVGVKGDFTLDFAFLFYFLDEFIRHFPIAQLASRRLGQFRTFAFETNGLQ